MGIVRMKDIHRIQRLNMNADSNWQRLMNIGYFNNGEKKIGSFHDVNNFWYKEKCFVVGSSVAGRGLDLNLLDGKHTIGVNHMIEYYNKFEWFVFQDLRFWQTTTCDLTKFKGRIFTSNNIPVNLDGKLDNVCKFIPVQTSSRVTTCIENGLFARPLTGLVALNLAICSGANRIYMIGMDMPKNFIRYFKDGNSSHYREDYNGEDKTKKSIMNTVSRLELFKKFIPFSDRIYNVCPGGTMDWFTQISLDEMIEAINE